MSVGVNLLFALVQKASATSREVLALAGETVFRVPSLDLPAGRHGRADSDL